MHNCPECQEMCWCDMEDHYNALPGDCIHDCEPDDWDDDEPACDACGTRFVGPQALLQEERMIVCDECLPRYRPYKQPSP